MIFLSYIFGVTPNVLVLIVVFVRKSSVRAGGRMFSSILLWKEITWCDEASMLLTLNLKGLKTIVGR